jgi:hypothetical protein
MSQDVLSAFVEATATRYGIPGVAVGVWADGREVHARHGVTSAENPLPVDRDTLYLLGSVTKTFTATALMRLAVPDRGGLNWESEPLEAAEGKLRCQWCRGAAGVGLCLASCYEVLGEPRYLTAAEAAGETTSRYGDVRANPSLCHGLGGNAALFLALHRATRRSRWLERAHAFAARALTYRAATPAGDVWQADAPDATSPDLTCGAAGVGHFLLHLLEPERVRLPFLWSGGPPRRLSRSHGRRRRPAVAGGVQGREARLLRWLARCGHGEAPCLILEDVASP